MTDLACDAWCPFRACLGCIYQGGTRGTGDLPDDDNRDAEEGAE